MSTISNDPLMERLLFKVREILALVLSVVVLLVGVLLCMWANGELARLSFIHLWMWAEWMIEEQVSLTLPVIAALAIPSAFALGVGFFARPRKKALGNSGGASFATRDQVREMGLLGNTEGVLLGKIGRDALIMDKPYTVGAFAPPGMGKTAGLVIPSLLTLHGSVFVSDIKGELFEKTSAYRATLGRLVKFAPGDEETAIWNPLCEKHLTGDWPDTVGQVMRIATLIYHQPSSGNVHFPLSARTMFTCLALYLVHKNGSTSLPEVRQFALRLPCRLHVFIQTLGIIYSGGALPTDDDGEVPEETILAIETLDIDPDNPPPMPPAVYETANRLGQIEKREVGSIVSTFNTPLDVFMDERIAAAFTGTSDFCALELKSGVVSVFNTVKEKNTARLSTLTRVLIDTLLGDLISLGNDPAHCRVTLVLDEFLRWGKIPSLIDSPAIQRGANVSSILIAQAGAQITDVYGPHALKKLKSTMSYFVIYCLNEFETAKDFSQQIGSALEKRQSLSKADRGDSTSLSFEERPLVSTEELMTLPEGEAIILCARFMKHPIRARQARYFEDKSMMQLIGEAEQCEYISAVKPLNISSLHRGDMFPVDEEEYAFPPPEPADDIDDIPA